MASVEIENVSLSYPIYGSNARSFKTTLVNMATGGRLNNDSSSVMVEALRDVSFCLEKGDRLAVVGHNGAGKSTLLKVLAKIYEPTKGVVNVQGRTNCLFDIMMGIDHELNAYENIMLRGLILGLSRPEIRKIVPRIEEFAELGDFMKMPIKSYSAGMKVRLAFGIITNVSSEILLIDEIVNVGDANFIEKAKAQMKSLVNRSEFVVLSSHDKQVIREFCNKALCLEKGVVKHFGKVEEVFEVCK
ncbi:MAG: ABC transporter ATP-binding protein [Rhabdochlamydiaceae bacterium]|jgi:ABC-type polysaccharide/polyol phosphate transport system ATPase subunit